MDNERVAKKVCIEKVKGKRPRRIPVRRWIGKEKESVEKRTEVIRQYFRGNYENKQREWKK